MQRNNRSAGSYQVPYINARYIIPILVLGIILFNIIYNREYWNHFFSIGTGPEVWSFIEKIPMLVFLVFTLGVTWTSYRKNLSLIPVLGLMSCMFLMTKLGHTNWLRFFIWLVVGLVIYFAFSRKNSKLNLSVKTHGIQEQ